jgi:hypothetical protein
MPRLSVNYYDAFLYKSNVKNTTAKFLYFVGVKTAHLNRPFLSLHQLNIADFTIVPYRRGAIYRALCGDDDKWVR